MFALQISTSNFAPMAAAMRVDSPRQLYDPTRDDREAGSSSSPAVNASRLRVPTEEATRLVNHPTIQPAAIGLVQANQPLPNRAMFPDYREPQIWYPPFIHQGPPTPNLPASGDYSYHSAATPPAVAQQQFVPTRRGPVACDDCRRRKVIQQSAGVSQPTFRARANLTLNRSAAVVTGKPAMENAQDVRSFRLSANSVSRLILLSPLFPYQPSQKGYRQGHLSADPSVNLCIPPTRQLRKAGRRLNTIPHCNHQCGHPTTRGSGIDASLGGL
jgi:hypothetical protein